MRLSVQHRAQPVGTATAAQASLCAVKCPPELAVSTRIMAMAHLLPGGLRARLFIVLWIYNFRFEESACCSYFYSVQGP